MDGVGALLAGVVVLWLSRPEASCTAPPDAERSP